MTLKEEAKSLGIKIPFATKKNEIQDMINKKKAEKFVEVPVPQEVKVAEPVVEKVVEVPKTIMPTSTNGSTYELKKKLTGEILATKPKRNIFIPLEPGEKKGTFTTVKINGYPFHIRKNTDVEVPAPVAELIRNRMGLDNTNLIDYSKEHLYLNNKIFNTIK